MDVPIPEPARFYDLDYQPQLQAIITGFLEQHGATRDDVLAAAIARAHGFHRTGAEIRARVLAAVQDRCIVIEETAGKFVWPVGADPSAPVMFRSPAPGQARDPMEVPMQELVALARPLLGLGLDDERILIAMRNSCGMARMGDRSRGRCQEALGRARESDVDFDGSR